MSITDVINKFNQDPFNIGGTGDSLLRSLDNQIAGQRAAAAANGKVGSPMASVNPLQLLQQQLFSNINSLPSYLTPIDQLRQQAQAQVNSQFDPLIQALQANMEGTTRRGHQSESDARSMYNSLAQDLASQIPGITNQMKQAQDATNQRYSNAQQQSNQDYQQQANQQQAILNQLGLQSAQQATQSQSAADQNYFQNQSNLQKQSDLDALQQQANSATNYQQNISDSSRMAGDNAAQSLENQLQDYLNQANGQLSGLQAQKQSGMAALLGQLQAADAQNAQQQRQNQIDNLMKMYNFQLDVQKEMDSKNASKSLFNGTSGPQGAANYLAQALPNRDQTASQILSLINDTMSDPNVIAGRHPEIGSNGKPELDPVTGKPMTLQNTDQYLEDLLRSKMENTYGGYSTGDINSAINALLAYLGKLR